MKKCELQESVKSAFLNPAAAFALGAVCGLAVGMLFLPFSKGIVIGSHKIISQMLMRSDSQGAVGRKRNLL